MNKIEFKSTIDKLKLDKKNYFISIVNEAIHCGLINEKELTHIQNDCLFLLKQLVLKINGEFSSSIRIEKAQDLMDSIMYILGLALNEFIPPDEAVLKLKRTNICDLYVQGIRRANLMMKSTKLLYSKIFAKRINIYNVYYNNTIFKQIRICLKKYNSEVSANEIPNTLDYPICIPINDLVGIEYISKYVISLYYETDFCDKFSHENINRIFSYHNNEYYESPVNIFRQVLIVAIGCNVANVNPKDLYISPNDFKAIIDTFSKTSIEGILLILNESINDLFHILGITKTSNQEYIKSCLESIANEIYLFSQINKLDICFMVEKTVEDFDTCFCYNNRMSSESFLKLKNKIFEEKHSEERKKLIIDNIDSVEDFFEIIHECIFSTTDIKYIIKDMDLVSTAVLFEKLSDISDDDLIRISIIEAINEKISLLDNGRLEIFNSTLRILNKYNKKQ